MAKGYQSYRGRRAATTKALAAILVAILLAACFFMVFQSYASYTDDGQLHFDLPPFLQQLFQKKETEDPPPEETDDPGYEEQDIRLVISEEDGDPDAAALPDAQPAEPAAPMERRLLTLGTLPADEAALSSALASAGAGGFLYSIRDNTGRVFYDSPTAADKAAVVDAAGTAALSALCAGDSLAVARFNCFHDSYYAFIHMSEAAICQKTGYVWYDYQSYHWLDPAKEQARGYVIGLALECVALGFDELLLEEMAYPSRGNLDKIDYSRSTMEKTDALVLFLTELRGALEPYGTKLSLLVSEDLLKTGSDADSGEDLTVLLPLVDAVYAQVSDIAAAEALIAQYAGDGPVPEFVPVVTEPGPGNWCLAAG